MRCRFRLVLPATTVFLSACSHGSAPGDSKPNAAAESRREKTASPQPAENEPKPPARHYRIQKADGGFLVVVRSNGDEFRLPIDTVGVVGWDAATNRNFGPDGNVLLEVESSYRRPDLDVTSVKLRGKEIPPKGDLR